MSSYIRWSVASLLILGVAQPGMSEDCTFHVSALAVAGVGNGSQAKPWTLQEANSEARSRGAIDPGDVVCLHADGVYSRSINPRGGGSAKGGRISYRNVPGAARAKFLTPGGRCVTLTDADWLRVSGVHCSGLDESLSDREIGPHLADGGARIISSHNVIENSFFDHLNKTGIYVGVGQYNIVRNNSVRYIGDWACDKAVQRCGSEPAKRGGLFAGREQFRHAGGDIGLLGGSGRNEEKTDVSARIAKARGHVVVLTSRAL